jgi:hypothetical protein
MRLWAIVRKRECPYRPSKKYSANDWRRENPTLAPQRSFAILNEIDELWDRLSHAYAVVRKEVPAEMIDEEMKHLHAKLSEQRQS